MWTLLIVVKKGEFALIFDKISVEISAWKEIVNIHIIIKLVSLSCIDTIASHEINKRERGRGVGTRKSEQKIRVVLIYYIKI